MEFIQGCTLKELVVIKGKFSLPSALNVVFSVGNALERIHTQTHIFHSDVSPENIMLTRGGQVKLLDFGSAKMLSKQASQNFTVVLKAGYAPPEQYSSVTPQGTYTDVYALASTLYYLLTGTKIPAAPARIDGAQYSPLMVCLPEVPKSISDAVDHALQLNRKSRTQTCQQFLAEMNQISKKERPLQPQMRLIQSTYVSIVTGTVSTQVPIEMGKILKVGRNRTCDIVLPQIQELSNLHFYLYYDKERQLYVVKDVSRNGIKIGSAPLHKNRFQPIKPGTVLILASGRCRVGVYG